ncbi:MAG: hypothetical protein WB791_06685 [Waddliaceae bacterium]
MKKQKVEKEVIYEGLGFPIVLRNVPMIELRKVWTLDIDLNILQKVVLLALAHHPSDMTGNQIRFVRNWLELTQTEFGKLFGVTHPAVVKWEKTGNKGSKMNLTTQRDLRLWLLDQLLSKDDDFRRAFKIIHMTDYSQPIEPLEFDVPTDLVAV